MTTASIVKVAQFGQSEIDVSEKARGRAVMISRLNSIGPWFMSAVGVVAATVIDVNWGAMAAGVTTVGMSAIGVFWFHQKKRREDEAEREALKLKAEAERESLKLKAFVDSENAKLVIARQARADELKAKRADARLRREIQAEDDRVNRLSLSAKLAQLEERELKSQELNKLQAELLVAMKKKIEDLAEYSHKAKHASTSEAQAILSAVETVTVKLDASRTKDQT